MDLPRRSRFRFQPTQRSSWPTDADKRQRATGTRTRRYDEDEDLKRVGARTRGGARRCVVGDRFFFIGWIYLIINYYCIVIFYLILFCLPSERRNRLRLRCLYFLRQFLPLFLFLLDLSRRVDARTCPGYFCSIFELALNVLLDNSVLIGPDLCKRLLPIVLFFNFFSM